MSSGIPAQRLTALLTTAALALGGIGLTASSADAVDLAPAPLHVAAAKAKSNAENLLDRLTVRAETRGASYDRERFDDWNDADRDGDDTRTEVLKAESTKRVTESSGTVSSGRWVSRYDGRVFTSASGLDIDHLVPLAEAWRSGAAAWGARKRAAYANDLGYGFSLIAVSAEQNRSKSDRDPAEWLPANASYHCVYARQYVAVKTRWQLAVDRAERGALDSALSTCSSLMVAKPAAPVVKRLVPPASSGGGSAGGSGSGGSGGGSGSGGSAYYRNCDAARAAGAAPVHRGDPGYGRHLDRDGDGVGCE